MLNKNFKDMLLALNEAGVEYLVVGAYALAAHGCPRATGDIDLWVRPNVFNAKRVWTALESFGAPMAPISVEDFATPDIVYQIGIPPQRIDILTSITGVDFTAAWDSRLKVEIDGMQVSILGLRDLLVNKSSTGRDKDQADLPTIRRLIQQQND
jgi:predicted nucleotidyltransferase